MRFPFEWNPYADQPHNVAPRPERLRHHVRRAGSYVELVAANLRTIVPIYARYRRLRRAMYGSPVVLADAFGCAVSPVDGRDEEVIGLLERTGIRQTLVRVPSWDRERLRRAEGFCRALHRSGFTVTAALLQNRQDVLDPGSWRGFLEEAFGRLQSSCAFFEVGHAWNRTKWGVWDFREYRNLAYPAFELAAKSGLRLVGPAVIDFEFHLFPVTLGALPFAKVSSLLYVDRVGAPENGQAGWTTPDKVALLKAAVDVSRGKREAGIWITEVNWPLEGTGKFSPASGRPNVSEEAQADYLVRYYILCLASGYVERVFWWQLVAPGYGLVDSRGRAWRTRPSYAAFSTMVEMLDGSRFVRRDPRPQAKIFYFGNAGRELAVCWTSGPPCEHRFARPVHLVKERDGRTLRSAAASVQLEGSPKYVVFR